MDAKNENILTLILCLLDVKYTKRYTCQYYEIHPHKNDLLGLSNMLSHYGVESEGMKLEKDIEALQSIEGPFVAYVEQSFAVVVKVKDGIVSYCVDKIYNSISYDEFLKKWSGVVLVIEKSETSIEPNYNQNRKQDLFILAMKCVFSFSLLLILIICGIKDGFRLTISQGIFIVINLAGLYVCYLLLLKQMDVKSSSADKICSVFNQNSDCNITLKSVVSKLYGIISLSEIGFGYFFTNLTALIYFQHLYPCIVILNICALPFTIWSVWYQRYKLKQWCPLCLLVQLFLWLIFLNSISEWNKLFSKVNIEDLLLSGSLYGVIIILMNMFLKYYMDSKEKRALLYELNNIKADENIFIPLLKSQHRYFVDSDFGLFIGNKTSERIITIITNPHCNPCASLHEQIDNLLNKKSCNIW